MATNKAPFSGTKEQEDALRSAIAELKGEKGSLMPIMQKAQDIYGYLPVEVQSIISNETGVPLETIYGIATFYAQFALEPKGRHTVSVCLGTACYVKGASLVLEKIEETLGIKSGQSTADGKFSIESCRCVGACGLAPVVMVGETVFGRMTPNKVPEVLAQFD